MFVYCIIFIYSFLHLSLGGVEGIRLKRSFSKGEIMLYCVVFEYNGVYHVALAIVRYIALVISAISNHVKSVVRI